MQRPPLGVRHRGDRAHQGGGDLYGELAWANTIAGLTIPWRIGDPYSVGKTMKRSQAQPGIPKLPNRETREAMKAAERGELEAAKDAADLLKKLKS